MGLFAGRRSRARVGGQTSIEIIVSVVLISLVIVLMVSFYGRTVLRKFSCAAQSVSSGQGLSFTCPGEAGGDDGEGAPEPEEAPNPDGEPSPGGDGSRRSGSGGDGRNAADGANDGDGADGGDDAGGASGADDAGGSNNADGSPGPAGGGSPGSGGGPSGGSGAPSGAQKTLEDAKELLKTTARGREILKFLDEKGIALELQAGDGSVYSAKQNKIVLDSAKSAEGLALTIAHEANHAEFDKTGKTANIDKDSRADFVRKMIEEEAVGTVASIQMKKDLQAAGKTITATYPLEKEYDAAFNKAVEDLKTAKPSATAAELDAAGKKAGLDAVRDGFNNGKVVTSNTKEKYPDYYGRAYDKRRAKPGSDPDAAPEPFELIPKQQAKTGFERLNGQIDSKERAAMESFMALDTVSEAVDLSRKAGQPFNSDYLGAATIVEVKNMGRSGPRFSISNPTKTVHDDGRGGSDRRPPTTSYYPDKTRNVIVEVKDPAAKTDFVVDASQSAGDVAFSVFQQRNAIRFQREDAKSFADAVGAQDPVKARADFAKSVVERVARRNLEQIDFKKKLQRAGGTVTTPIPLEAEFDAAYNKAFAQEMEKSGRVNDAVAAGTNAANQAVRDTIESGRIVTHTGEKYADYFGKEFDKGRAEFVQKNPDVAKKQEEALKAQERQAKRDAAIKALAELVNSTDPDNRDPNKPNPDKVIELVGAIVPTLSSFEQIQFTTQAEKGLEKLLGPFGYRTVTGDPTRANIGRSLPGLQRDRLDYALTNHSQLNEYQRKELRRNPIAATKYGIRLGPTSDELAAEDAVVAIRKLPLGGTHQGSRAEFKIAKENQAINHALDQLNQIRGAGPLSLVGRAACGEKCAVIGGLGDTLVAVRTVQKARTQVRTQIQDSKSGGNVVSRADDRLAPINVRRAPAPPPKREVQPDRLAPPPKPPANRVGSNQGAKEQQAQQQQQKQDKPVARDQQTNPGGDTGVDLGRQQRQQDQKAADARRAADAKQAAARAARDKQRQEDLKKRVDESNKFLDRTAKNLPRDDQKVTPDDAISRAEKGDFGIVISMNGRRHQEAFEDKHIVQERAAGRRPDVSKLPPPPTVFTDGKMVRIDFQRLTDAQKARVQKLATGGSPGGGGPAGPPVDPRGATIDPKGATQPQGGAQAPRASGGIVRFDPGQSPPPRRQQQQGLQGQQGVRLDGKQGQGPPPQPRGQNQQRQQQVQQQKTNRDDIKTGEMPKLDKPQVSSADLEKQAKAIANVSIRIQPGKADPPGVGPGKFSDQDVAFGLARADGKPKALLDFAGKAKIPGGGTGTAAQQVRNVAPGAENLKFDSIERNERVADNTVAFARNNLGATGQLRFNLKGFSVEQALTPGSGMFHRITSAELRRVLSDPFFSGRVKFYDANGKDVTAQTLQDAQRFLKNARGS